METEETIGRLAVGQLFGGTLIELIRIMRAFSLRNAEANIAQANRTGPVVRLRLRFGHRLGWG